MIDRVRVALVLVLLGLAACSGSPTRSDGTPDISGAWVGTWTSTAPGNGGGERLMAQLRQSGQSLEGDRIFIEHLCVSGFTLSGSISGNQVQMTVLGVVFNDRTEFTGTVSADRQRMFGGYTITGGLCAGSPSQGDAGTWELAR